LVGEGLWGDPSGGDEPCLITRATGTPASAQVLGGLRAEARILGLLDGVAGIPQLLHLDDEAGLLVQSQPAGVPLTAVPSELLRRPATALRIALRVAGILECMHAARLFHGDLQPGHIVFDAATGNVSVGGLGAAVLQSHVDAGFVHAASIGRPLPFSAPEQTGRLGREPELARLNSAWDAADSPARVAMVSGFSGTGKSALVGALHPTLSKQDGIFAAGKFDQYRRLTPFSGRVEALSELADYWLAEAPPTLLQVRTQLV
jgi:hypothetical protein